ncbi:MAG: glycosyltransferase family 2 protein [Clostridium fessum]
MNKKPCISVIVPIFNMDAYLRTCLDSILGQTLDNIEVVCINDGSTDYTQSILEEYSWNDKE